MPRITVVGLGPGNPQLITTETLNAIERIPVRFLRTQQHPSAHLVPNATSFDDVYDTASSFDSVYDSITAELLSAARTHLST